MSSLFLIAAACVPLASGGPSPSDVATRFIVGMGALDADLVQGLMTEDARLTYHAREVIGLAAPQAIKALRGESETKSFVFGQTFTVGEVAALEVSEGPDSGEDFIVTARVVGGCLTTLDFFRDSAERY